jgi:protein-S-isoprenylcysteine O-methyltransferase Ste14
VKASALEFRLRYLIHIVIFVLGFTAPWNRPLHIDSGLSSWLSLAGWAARNHWLTFSAATITLLVIALICAFKAAFLRTWASAYLGVSVVHDAAMHGDRVVAAGPYRYLRNPLYLGVFFHTLALALLMPPSGAIFCIVAIGLFELRLIAGEEAFLTAKLGESYRAYCAKVPRLIPSLTPRLPASSVKPAWSSAFLGEIYFWGVVASFAIVGWRYNALLIGQGILISLGVSLVVRALIPKDIPRQPPTADSM